MKELPCTRTATSTTDRHSEPGTPEELGTRLGSSWTADELVGYLEHLYLERYTQLITFAQERLGSWEEAEDAWGTFVAEHAPSVLFQFDPDRGRRLYSWLLYKFANYCKDITRRKANQNTRQKRYERFAVEVESQDRLVDPTSSLEAREVLQKMLDDLPEQDRRLFEARFVEERPLKEIAIELDVPEGTVKSRLFTLRQKLPVVIHELEHPQSQLVEVRLQ